MVQVYSGGPPTTARTASSHILDIPECVDSYVTEYQECCSYEGSGGYSPRVVRVLTNSETGEGRTNSETGVGRKRDPCTTVLSVAGLCAFLRCFS